MPAFYRDDEYDRWEAWEDRMESAARPHFSPGERAAKVERELNEISLDLRGLRPNPLIPKKGGEG
jgi:hypothetical protein